MPFIPRDASQGTGGGQVCTEESCLRVAADILGSLALNYTKIDPCTDFDKFACGNWAAHNPIPAGRIRLSALEIQVYESVRPILEGSYPSKDEGGWITVDLTEEQVEADKDNFANLKKAYDVCNNYTALYEEGLDPLRELVSEVADLFPETDARAIKGKNATFDHSATLGKSIAFFESLGIETFQRFVQTQNPIDPEEVLINLLEPKAPGLPSEEGLEEYMELATDLLAAVHPANLTRAHVAELMEGVALLQVAISGAAKFNDPSITDPFKSIADIHKTAPQLNYEEVVRHLAPDGFKADKIWLTANDWFKRISQILSKTPTDILEAFFIWKFVASLSPYIESDLTHTYNDFLVKDGGGDPESPAPRWRKCVGLVDTGPTWFASDDNSAELLGPAGLTWIVSRFFVDKHVPAEAKELTADMVENVKEAFLERIETRDWASKKVKDASAEKLHAMATSIALPLSPNVTDPLKIKKYYSDIVVSSSFAANVISFAHSAISRNWATLGKPADHEKWASSALETNALYSPSQNRMLFLAGPLQYPFMDIDFPAYLLYGAMGSVVGHEITHGFDNQGRLRDKTGNLTTWWDDESIEAFENKTECFVNQYDNFPIFGPDGKPTYVNGTVTLGENIADAGGVATSYNAWKKLVSDKGKDKDLPGLDKFTHDQIFFLRWGQTWCQNISPENLVASLDGATHPPGPARILLVLQNTPGFGKAFKCPSNKDTCELW